MSLTSNLFILFVSVCLILYYIVPKKCQWIFLLIFSYMYYMYNSMGASAVLMLSTLVTYVCGIGVAKAEQNEQLEKEQKNKKKKRILIINILFNVGMLAFLKYTNFFITNINLIGNTKMPLLNLILPLGISYYTFQSIGYILDVYWGRTEAEKNPFRFALFVSFFPQLIQGPISRYNQLADQLYAEHYLEIENIKHGVERIIWGFFKKMVLADWAAVYVDAIFQQPEQYSGIVIFGLLLYSVELYGNFSGGIDIVLGIAEMFGIHLAENFQRPFFATSVTDFWHRWHITLGTWMKDYVFYPLTLSKAMKKCGKHAKKIFGKKTGRAIPVCIANLIVFFIVGVWHGPTWNNIGWGIYNGIIIAFSGLFGDVYTRIKNRLHINDKANWYQVFMILRTFIIMNISWYFDCVNSFGTAWTMIGNSFTKFAPSELLLISSGKLGTEYTPYALAILVAGCIILFIVSVLQERGIKVRQSMDRTPLVIQFAVFFILLSCIPLLGPAAVARGFIYAQF